MPNNQQDHLHTHWTNQLAATAAALNLRQLLQHSPLPTTVPYPNPNPNLTLALTAPDEQCAETMAEPP